MTNKDLFRLAKISLASRKKTTRSTVRGIAFGLILLVPVLFIAFGIFGDLNRKVNANPEMLYMNLQTAAVRSGQSDVVGNTEYYDRSTTAFSSQHAENVKKNVKSHEVYEYEQILAPFNPYLVDNGVNENFNLGDSSRKAFDITYGDGEEKEIYVFTSGYNYGHSQGAEYSKNTLDVPFAAIVGEDGKFAPTKMQNKFGSVFVRGGGFTGTGKGQVILSETFLAAIGLTADDVYDKTFSIKYNDYKCFSYDRETYIDNNADPDDNVYAEQNGMSQFPYDGEREIYFCQDFKVVGVVKNEVTTYAMNAYGAGSDYGIVNHIMTNMMFFTTASVYHDENEVLEPVVKLVKKEEDDNDNNSYYASYFVGTYTQSQSEFERLNKEYMAFGATSFNSRNYNLSRSSNAKTGDLAYQTRNVFVDPATFNELDSAAKTVKAEFSALLGDNAKYLVQQVFVEVYSNLRMVYNAFTYVVLGMSVIGGIIFFASMVNLFNSIVHSVDSRKSYLGVLRAVGAKRSLINRMYMAESLTIFKRAFIWILIFATAICVGIKLLLDLLFKSLNETGLMGVELAVSYVYIPIALAVALGVLLILGFAFSYGCSWKVSRAPITKTLAA
ncbi:MAG: ABC transporter permease [Clostridiales bacterium]|nr:ABC transporter permease [Clostridiales bacterium]